MSYSYSALLNNPAKISTCLFWQQYVDLGTLKEANGCLALWFLSINIPSENCQQFLRTVENIGLEIQEQFVLMECSLCTSQWTKAFSSISFLLIPKALTMWQHYYIHYFTEREIECQRHEVTSWNHTAGRWENQDLNPRCLARGSKFSMAPLYCQIINGLEESSGSPDGFQEKDDVFSLLSARRRMCWRSSNSGDHLGA